MTAIRHRLTVVAVALALALAASVVPSDYANALPCEDCPEWDSYEIRWVIGL